MADFVTTALGTSEVAHALKAPLITIEKSLSLLREPGTGPLNDTQQKFLTIAERNLQLVTKVLGDFLDTARLDAGTLRLLRKPGPVDDAVRRVVDEAQPAAGAKNIALTYRTSGSLPVAFDPARLPQAIAHLLEQVVTLTPASGRITVEVKPRDPWMDIVIINTGTALFPEDLAHLFERHVPSGGKADAHGFGLGLPLAKGLIELHQGRLAVAHDTGVGTTWTVSLPVDRTPPGPGGAASAVRRILLVDDDADFRETIGALLRQKNYEVVEAGRGDDALATLQQQRVDIVFLDLHLPPTDGFVVLKQIRAMQRDLPVVMITAYPEDEAVSKARQLGISAFFTKDGSYQELMALLDVTLRRHKAL